MIRANGFTLIAFAAVGMIVAWPAPELAAQDSVTFDVRWLTIDANEGCAVADVDGDGRLDVVAGRNWFRNSDWLPRPLRSIEDWNGYVISNGDFILDVNRDGRPDVIAGGFLPTEVHWYENPGADGLSRGTQWAQHLLVDTQLSQNEASYLHDFDGDGTPEWISNSWNRDNPMVIWRWTDPASIADSANNDPSRERLTGHVVGPVNGHGIGFGDINNDGREDIVFARGWYERPQGDPFASAWTYHADWDGHFSCPMLVTDVDDDGRNDLVWGSPHDFGLNVWFARAPAADGSLSFDRTEVDASFSQLHCIHLADIDGDGRDELITGKRVRAHNGGDPGASDPPLVCYYDWEAGKRDFRRHIIHRGEVGIGLQIRSADLDDDGDLDLVLAGKDGTQILFNQLR